jgi:phage antirepressor YoqD-like protein
MNKTEETPKTKFGCEFCGRSFVRETTVFKHICEYKHRWQEKDKPGNRIAYQLFLQFMKKNTASKKVKPYEEFIKSPYYTAFIKFGIYCIDVNCVNPSRLIDWLIKNKIKIDDWCSDQVYTKFLCEYLRVEDPLDAIARSIETTIELANEANIKNHDIFKYANSNKICYAITTGKISPWILYHSDSGISFLNNLSTDQQNLIMDYINPELWAIKFKRDSGKISEVKDLLHQAGY